MIDPIFSQILIAIIVNVPVWYVMRSTARKQGGDAYAALSDALRTSGTTIGELLEQLAELPALRQELAQVKADWRDDNIGAWANHQRLIDHEIEPAYVPRKRYSTQPLPAMKK